MRALPFFLFAIAALCGYALWLLAGLNPSDFNSDQRGLLSAAGGGLLVCTLCLPGLALLAIHEESQKRSRVRRYNSPRTYRKSDLRRSPR